MEIFDERPGFVYLEDIEYSTLINEAESGKEKRRNKWPEGCAKRTFKLTYKVIAQSRYSSILQFFNDRSGMKEAFYWENFNESPVSKIYPSGIIVDPDYQGQDTTNLRHYPVIEDSETIYDDGVALTKGVHYSIIELTGEIAWIIKPSNGSVITADYRFYRVVRFDNDKLSPGRVAFEKYDLELLLKEIEPRM